MGFIENKLEQRQFFCMVYSILILHADMYYILLDGTLWNHLFPQLKSISVKEFITN